MKTQELVSVIITTYHNETLLPRAIESVLHQTYDKIELIVVDDNHPDSPSRKATEILMEQYPQVIYLKHTENRNGAAARNTGIAYAHGTYIAFLDNDDIYLEHHIESCVDALHKNPDCDAALCGVVKVCDGLCWDVIYPENEDMLKAVLLSERALGTGSNLFVSSAAIREISGFDESFIRHQDVEFGLRLFQKYRADTIPEIQIIKDMGSFSNMPGFESFRTTKYHLWNSFSELLNTLTEEERIRFYEAQYSALLYSACQSGKAESIKWSLQNLTKYRPLNKKEIILVGLTKLHLFSFYELLKLLLFKKKHKQKYQCVAAQLNDKDQQTLQKALGKD